MHRPFLLVTCVSALLLGGCQASAASSSGDEIAGKRCALQLFQLSDKRAPIFIDEIAVDRGDPRVARRTQIVLIKSDVVLESAARSLDLPKQGSIPTDRELPNWIRERLVVRFPSDSNVLQIALVDARAPEEAMVAIVRAISKAYLDEVIFESKIQQQKPRDILAASYRELDEEIKRKTDAYQALLKDSSSIRLPEIALRVELLKQQIARLADARVAAELEMLRRLVEVRLAEPRAEASGEAGDDPPTDVVRTLYSEHIAKLDATIKKLAEQAEELCKEDPDLAARAAELEQLRSVQAEISRRIEQWDVELKAPLGIWEFGGVRFHEGE